MTAAAVPKPRKIALSVELTPDTAAVQVVGARRTPEGLELPPVQLPNHVMSVQEVMALFFQFAKHGMIQQARLLPDGTKVWGPLQGQYRAAPASPTAAGNGRRILLPGDG